MHLSNSPECILAELSWAANGDLQERFFRLVHVAISHLAVLLHCVTPKGQTGALYPGESWLMLLIQPLHVCPAVLCTWGEVVAWNHGELPCHHHPLSFGSWFQYFEIENKQNFNVCFSQWVCKHLCYRLKKEIITLDIAPIIQIYISWEITGVLDGMGEKLACFHNALCLLSHSALWKYFRRAKIRQHIAW